MKPKEMIPAKGLYDQMQEYDNSKYYEDWNNGGRDEAKLRCLEMLLETAKEKSYTTVIIEDPEYKAWKRKTSILLGRQSGSEVASRNWALMTELERLELYKKHKYE